MDMDCNKSKLKKCPNSERNTKKKLRKLLGLPEGIQNVNVKKEPKNTAKTSAAFNLKTKNVNIKLEKNASNSKKTESTGNKSAKNSTQGAKKIIKTETVQVKKGTAGNVAKVKSKTQHSYKKNTNEAVKATSKVKPASRVNPTDNKKSNVSKVSSKNKKIESKIQTTKSNIKKNAVEPKKEKLKPEKLKNSVSPKPDSKSSSSNQLKRCQRKKVLQIKKGKQSLNETSKVCKKNVDEKKRTKPKMNMKTSTVDKKPKCKNPTNSKCSKMDDSIDDILVKYSKLVKMSKDNKVVLPNLVRKREAKLNNCPVPEKTAKTADITVQKKTKTRKNVTNGNRPEKKNKFECKGKPEINGEKRQKFRKHLRLESNTSTSDSEESESANSLESSYEEFTENSDEYDSNNDGSETGRNSSWTSYLSECDNSNSNSVRSSDSDSNEWSDCSDCEEDGEEEEEDDEEYSGSSSDEEYSGWSTDSSDFCPSSDNEAVYIPKGCAIKHDAPMDTRFDSDAEEIQIFEISSEYLNNFNSNEAKAIECHEIPKNVIPICPVTQEKIVCTKAINQLPISIEEKNKPLYSKLSDDSDSCPELIPIDFENDLFGSYKYNYSDSDSSRSYFTDEDASFSESSDVSMLSKEEISSSVKPESKVNIQNVHKPPKTKPIPIVKQNEFYNSINSNYVLALVRVPIYVYGTLNLKTVAGDVEIFGYSPKLNENIKLFSPKGYSSLEIKPKYKTNQINIEKLKLEIFHQYENDFLNTDLQEIMKNYNSQTDVILHLECNDDDKKIVMIKKYMKENVFPNMNAISATDRSTYASEIILRCLLNSKSVNCINIDSQWDMVKLNKSSKTIIIGGKGVGKSTLLRYLVNTTLSNRSIEKILIIDLDIGQPELFIPQTISATVIDTPLLGPGFFYGYVPNKSFVFGNTNVVISPMAYLENVKELIKYCFENEEFKNIPWVVNTMGYNKGFGSELIAAITKLLRPTNIIQLQSQLEINNFDYIMNKETIEKIPSFIFGDMEEHGNNVKLNHHTTVIDSFMNGRSRRNGEWSMSPIDMRYTILLARFGQILEAGFEWLTDVKPVCSSLTDLEIITFGEDELDKDDIINAVNGNLVYLCSKLDGSTKLDNEQIFECHGIGIVRGIDLNQQKIYLLPSCTADKLINVNCLALCNIPLPTSISLNQGPKIKANVPYVYNTIEFDASKSTKQIYFRPETYFQGNSKPVLD